MQHIEHNLRSIKRRIMLRVWYAYALSLTKNPFMLAGLVFGASVTLFVNLVSVPSIIMNLLDVRLGSVPEYIGQTLLSTWTNGNFLKLVSLVLIVASVLYLRTLLKHSTFNRNLTQSA
jgi:hypothetical protein